jgi:hypothetical protein
MPEMNETIVCKVISSSHTSLPYLPQTSYGRQSGNVLCKRPDFNGMRLSAKQQRKSTHLLLHTSAHHLVLSKNAICVSNQSLTYYSNCESKCAHDNMRSPEYRFGLVLIFCAGNFGAQFPSSSKHELSAGVGGGATLAWQTRLWHAPPISSLSLEHH